MHHVWSCVRRLRWFTTGDSLREDPNLRAANLRAADKRQPYMMLCHLLQSTALQHDEWLTLNNKARQLEF